MSQTDPTQAIDDQAQDFVILCAVDPITKNVFPCTINPVTGEINVNAEFTGDVVVDIDKAEKIEISNTLTLDGSIQQLAAQALKSEIVLKADPGNVATLWIGDLAVGVDDGLPLEPGESVSFPVDNSDGVYTKGTVADKLHYMGG